MKKMSYVIRFAVISIVLLASNSVFCQDTVRLNDERFLFPQIRYFSRGERETPGGIGLGHGTLGECFGYECTLDKEKGEIYGIAIAISSFPSNLWLKIMDSVPGNGSNTVMDSVRIYQDLEQKVLILDEIMTNENGELTDSILEYAKILYCGYFDRPVHVDDSSFFVYAELAAGYATFPMYCIHPDITKYCYGVEHIFGERIGSWYIDTVHSNIWLPILPIIAPPPGWTEAPDDPEDPDDPQDPDNPDNPGGDEGIGEADGVPGFDMRPNPTSGVTTVSCAEAITELTVRDMAGRVVLHKSAFGTTDTFDTSTLRKGVYLVKVTTTRGTVTKKLVVE